MWAILCEVEVLVVADGDRYGVEIDWRSMLEMPSDVQLLSGISRRSLYENYDTRFCQTQQSTLGLQFLLVLLTFPES